MGIDVSTSRIKSIIDNIETNKKTFYEALESEEVLRSNELIEKLNAERKKGQPVLQLIQNIAKRNEKTYGKLVNQDEVDRIQQRFLLNNAVYNFVRPLAEAFTLGKIDPRLAEAVAQPMSWKMLSKAEKDSFLKQENEAREKDGKKPLTGKGAVLEFAKQQKERIKAITDAARAYEKHQHSKTEGEETVEGDVDEELMRKEAAQNLIDFELELHEDLRRINHREHLRNEASPIEVKEAADNGDTDAQVVLDEELSKQISEGSEEGPTTPVENSDLGYVDMTMNSDEARPGDVEPATISDEARPGDVPQMSDKEKALRERLGMPTSDETRPQSATNSDESVPGTTSSSDEEVSSIPSTSDEIENSDAIAQLNQNAIEYDFNRDGVSNRYDDYL